MMEGRAGAAFCIYWGEVSDDSDGPVEWCRPVLTDRAEQLAAECRITYLADPTTTTREGPDCDFAIPIT